MISAMFAQPNYLATKKILDATALRHEAIASNLANIETPNYKRLDVAPTFSTELQQAMRSGAPDRIAAIRPTLGFDPAAQTPNRDGNTVQLENELMQLTQNSLNHQVSSQLISGSLLKMRLAITGRA